jgi:hypothetical protein
VSEESEEKPYEVEEYPPYEFEIQRQPGEHIRVRSKRVQPWGEEESEMELPLTAYFPYEEFVLPASTASIGSALTGLGIAQKLFPNIAQLFQKYLPFLTAKITIFTVSMPIITLVGLGLIGFSIFLTWISTRITIRI